MEEPNGKLALQPWMVMAETVRVMDALTPPNDKSKAPRFVGGCVRNALVNRKVVDIDIATPLKPDETIEMLQAAGIPHIPTGLRHGTVTALVDGRPYEITTLRLDVMTFGRHADVKFTDDWKTDAARRDFTINTMSCDMDGNVYDYFNGISDLRQGRVIFVGDAERRITEDYLRILRYFRFLAHFGRGTPDAAALHACQKGAVNLRKLSGERVRQEILRLLEAPLCAATWHLMLQAGVVTHILPEATDWKRLEYLVTLESRFEAPLFPLRRLASLMIVTPEGLKHAVQSLKLSAAEGAQLFSMIKYSGDVSPYTDDREMRRIVYHHGNDMAHSLVLLAAADKGAGGNLDNLYDIAVGFRPPRLPVTGADVMALGVKSGPDVGHLLSSVENWWLASDFKQGRDACLAELKRLTQA